MNWKNVGASALGKLAKKGVSNVIGWGAKTIFGVDQKTVADNVYDTLEAVGVAHREAEKMAGTGLMTRAMPSLDFEGISYAKQKMATGPKPAKVIGAEKMDKEWELLLMSDYFVQTRYTPKASDIASQVTKIPISRV